MPGRDCVGLSAVILALIEKGSKILFNSNACLIGASDWALCFHYVLWDPVERYKVYGTNGLTFLKKENKFHFHSFIHKWMKRKLKQWRKNVEYEGACNSFWGSITIVVLVFLKKKLEKKRTILKVILSCDVHQSLMTFPENSSVLQSDTSTKQPDNGHSFHKS